MSAALWICGPIVVTLAVVYGLMKMEVIPGFGILEPEVGSIEYRTGDEPTYQRQMPGIPKYSQIRLKWAPEVDDAALHEMRESVEYRGEMREIDPPQLVIPMGYSH